MALLTAVVVTVHKRHALSQGNRMSFVQVGEPVRIYYEEDCFDEGEVKSVRDGVVVVDFYDWIEQWSETDFSIQELFLEGKEVLVPNSNGTVIVDFRRS